jgi:integrase
MFSWTRSWRKLVAECGMPGFRFHDLRHTFRTWGAEAGVPLEVMMAQGRKPKSRIRRRAKTEEIQTERTSSRSAPRGAPILFPQP